MNYTGSYRKLLGNAKAAMMSAVEIYNKPMFLYRDECTTILVINAWELLLKSILSKNGISIYYPKRKGEPYRTLTWKHAYDKATGLFDSKLSPNSIRANLELLEAYRDNAVHFYNADGFGIIVYALSQTSIMNFRDVLNYFYDQRLEEEINWQLMPLGIRPPIDVLTYISGKESEIRRTNAVRQFLAELAKTATDIKQLDEDTGRLLTVFNVKLESIKKIGDADIVVGVDKPSSAADLLAFERKQDPNISHPLRQKDVVERIARLHGKKFTSHTFQAIVWKYGLKTDPQYCWEAKEGVLTKYSHDIVPFIKRLTNADVVAALTDYKADLKRRRASKKTEG